MRNHDETLHVCRSVRVRLALGGEESAAAVMSLAFFATIAADVASGVV